VNRGWFSEIHEGKTSGGVEVDVNDLVTVGIEQTPEICLLGAVTDILDVETAGFERSRIVVLGGVLVFVVVTAFVPFLSF